MSDKAAAGAVAFAPAELREQARELHRESLLLAYRADEAGAMAELVTRREAIVTELVAAQAEILPAELAETDAVEAYATAEKCLAETELILADILTMEPGPHDADTDQVRYMRAHRDARAQVDLALQQRAAAHDTLLHARGARAQAVAATERAESALEAIDLQLTDPLGAETAAGLLRASRLCWQVWALAQSGIPADGQLFHTADYDRCDAAMRQWITETGFEQRIGKAAQADILHHMAKTYPAIGRQ